MKKKKRRWIWDLISDLSSTLRLATSTNHMLNTWPSQNKPQIPKEPCKNNLKAHLKSINYRLTASAAHLNIARGTADPEIDSVTWIGLGNKIAPLTLVAYLATRWRHLHYLQIWPTYGAIYISCKFGLQMAPLALVAKLSTRWRHLH